MVSRFSWDRTARCIDEALQDLLAPPLADGGSEGSGTSPGESPAATEASFEEYGLASDVMEQEISAHIAQVGDAIDGVFAASDVIAMTALRVLADRGLVVPDRIRVIGYDDLPLAAQTVPRLTTIRQDIATGAKAMVDALFARIAGEDAASVQMNPVLVRRDSA